MKKTDNIPKIPIFLDRQRWLHLNLTAVARFEAITGKPVFHVKTRKRISKKDTVLWLWACLSSIDDPALKPEDLIRLLDTHKINWDTVQESVDKLNSQWQELITNSILTGGEI